MTSARKILAHNIKKYRQIENLSQEELSFRCHLHRTYISSIERCNRNVSIDNIEKIANALHVTSADLLKETKYISNPEACND